MEKLDFANKTLEDMVFGKRARMEGFWTDAGSSITLGIGSTREGDGASPDIVLSATIKKGDTDIVIDSVSPEQSERNITRALVAMNNLLFSQDGCAPLLAFNGIKDAYDKKVFLEQLSITMLVPVSVSARLTEWFVQFDTIPFKENTRDFTGFPFSELDELSSCIIVLTPYGIGEIPIEKVFYSLVSMEDGDEVQGGELAPYALAELTVLISEYVDDYTIGDRVYRNVSKEEWFKNFSGELEEDELGRIWIGFDYDPDDDTILSPFYPDTLVDIFREMFFLDLHIQKRVL